MRKVKKHMNDTPYDPIFNIVLVNPEIPQNTGNIGRLSVATRSHLRLVHPLGFLLDDKSRRRAGLDYWDRLLWSEHDSFAAVEDEFERGQLHLFSKKGSASLYETSFKKGDALVFGAETRGLPAALLEKYRDRVVTIPMLGDVRSLNLANSVGISVFEALRKSGLLH